MPSKIRKQSADTWLLTVSVGYDEKGKQIVKRKTVKASQADVRLKRLIIFLRPKFKKVKSLMNTVKINLLQKISEAIGIISTIVFFRLWDTLT